MDKYLTIFTPTYNRGYILHKLYESLCNQTNKSFTWLVVDDGSTDDTKTMIGKWINEGLIAIKYIYQKNQGKHIAHNTGVKNCTTELFFCVDSDDYLLENAVQDILKNRDRIKDNHISGIVSVRITKDGKEIGTPIPKDINYSTLSHLYEKHKFKGDTALVFKADILRSYMFPKIEGERFVGEEFIYSQIDENHKLYISKHKYYVCEYLDDGYTNNMFKLISDNPKGYMLLKKMKLKVSKGFKVRYKAAALYVVGAWLAGEKGYIQDSPGKWITIASMPLALLVYCIRFLPYK